MSKAWITDFKDLLEYIALIIIPSLLLFTGQITYVFIKVNFQKDIAGDTKINKTGRWRGETERYVKCVPVNTVYV